MNKQAFVTLASDVLEQHFPKGHCKERGEAMVLVADLLRSLMADGTITDTKEEVLTMDQEQFDKIREYLMQQGQQELVGHLDGFKQEYDELHDAQYPNRDDEAPADDSSDTPLAEGETPAESQTSAQDFQDKHADPNTAGKE